MKMKIWHYSSEKVIFQAIVRPMSRKDIFYGGSVMQLAEEQVRELGEGTSPVAGLHDLLQG